MSTHLASRWQRARKLHRCWYCGEDIVPGDRYHLWIGIWEGDFGVTKTHEECEKAWQSMYSDRTLLSDDGLDFGEYWRGTTVRRDESLERPAKAGEDDHGEVAAASQLETGSGR